MTTQQLIDRFKALLAYDLDGYVGASPTDASVVAVLNDALLEIGEAAHLYDHNVALTLTEDQSVYDLRDLSGPTVARAVVAPMVVYIGDNPLEAIDGAHGLWPFDIFRARYPHYATDASGTPTKATFYGTSLVLHPAPNAAAVALVGTRVEGQVLPAPLSAASLSTEPELPAELHDALAQLAAAKAADPNCTEGHQESRAGRMAAYAMGRATQVGRRNRRAVGFGGALISYPGVDRLIEL